MNPIKSSDLRDYEIKSAIGRCHGITSRKEYLLLDSKSLQFITRFSVPINERLNHEFGSTLGKMFDNTI